MAKSKNHTAHNQSKKNHRNGIKKPTKYKYTSTKGVSCAGTAWRPRHATLVHQAPAQKDTACLNCEVQFPFIKLRYPTITLPLTSTYDRTEDGSQVPAQPGAAARGHALLPPSTCLAI